MASTATKVTSIQDKQFRGIGSGKFKIPKPLFSPQRPYTAPDFGRTATSLDAQSGGSRKEPLIPTASLPSREHLKVCQRHQAVCHLKATLKKKYGNSVRGWEALLKNGGVLKGCKRMCFSEWETSMKKEGNFVFPIFSVLFIWLLDVV